MHARWHSQGRGSRLELGLFSWALYLGLSGAILAQDLSSKLHLCVMLRSQPMVHQAVVMVVNGSRFFDLYIPGLGMDMRIQVADMLPTLRTTWNAQER